MIMTNDQKQAVWGWVSRISVYSIVSSALLFLIAGNWAWAGGWLYVVLQVVNVILSYCMLYRHKPELLIRRKEMGEGTPTWDKILAPMMAFSTLLISLVSAVGVRFSGQMPVTDGVLLFAFLGMTAGHILTLSAMRTNAFFEGSVRIQKEFDHQVVNSGPYQVVRHPGYLGVFVYNTLLPIVLMSAWGFAGVGFFLIVLIWRTAREDHYLWTHLPGYDDFTKETPWRLFPWVW
jgi:protein-S-isoprenylcysteine O-methyltransferase Ste14